MKEGSTIEFFDEKKPKDKMIIDLKKKLEETEKKLNDTKKQLDEITVSRTVEINRLIKDKARFIDNLSHDLATPLTPLISLLPVVREDVKSDESTKLLDTCLKNVKYMKRVIENARELADISASNFLLKKESLYDIVDEITVKYNVVFKSYNIRVENKIDKDTLIKTEKNRLLQLFDHLISNAVNSMPEGGSLSFESKSVKKDDKNFIQISVKDTGKGLTREETDHIFDEFYKTDESRHKIDSTGLGLTICRKIVEKHGGKIWGDSHGKDTGVTISFTLPSSDVAQTRSFI